MAVYRFEGPDGKIHRVEAESPEAAQRGLEAHFAAKKPSVASDVAQSIPSGLVQGVRGMADAFLDTAFPMLPKGSTQSAMSILGAMTGPRGKALAAASRDGAYTPKTVPGQFARTAAAFAAGAPAIPGSLGLKAAATAIPALASETAGQLPGVKGTAWEAPARAVGAIAGGAASPAALDAASIPFRPKVAPKPVLRAAGAVERAIQRDNLAPADVVASARKSAAPAFMSGGDNLTSLAEVTAQSPGSARTTIRDTVQAHRDTAPDQIKGDVAQALGGSGDYFATLEKAREQRLQLAMPYRDKAFATPLDPKVFKSEIEPILSRTPQSAINLAEQIARREGRNPEEIGFIVERMPGGGSVNVRVSNPTMETLHYVKKGMDQDLSQFRDGLGRLDLEGQPLAAATSKVRGDLGRAMRRSSKDYDAFMQTWGDESQHVEALRLGRDVFSSKPELGYEQLKSHIAEMSPAAREMYTKGVGEALVNQVRSSKGGVGTMRALLRSEEYRDRIRLAFPSEQTFQAFVESAAQRVREQDGANRVLGGSPTYARQAAAADLNAQPVGGLDIAAGAMDLGSPAALTGRALKEALKAIPRKDRSVLGDPESNATLGRALTNADELERIFALLEAEKRRRTIRPLGELTPALGLLSASQPRP